MVHIYGPRPGLSECQALRSGSEVPLGEARAASELTERMRGAAEAEDADALRAIEDEIGDLGTASPELPVDLLLAYRDVSAWADMIRCVEAMPATTRDVVTVREQHALALNRRNGPGDRKQALKILRAVLERYGPSPETCGILGRCYKDAWQQATDADLKALALDEAIEAYSVGLDADPRDYYPGINLATLLLARGTEADLKRLGVRHPGREVRGRAARRPRLPRLLGPRGGTRARGHRRRRAAGRAGEGDAAGRGAAGLDAADDGRQPAAARRGGLVRAVGDADRRRTRSTGLSRAQGAEERGDGLLDPERLVVEVLLHLEAVEHGDHHRRELLRRDRVHDLPAAWAPAIHSVNPARAWR